jgi:hypothetical protein
MRYSLGGLVAAWAAFASAIAGAQAPSGDCDPEFTSAQFTVNLVSTEVGNDQVVRENIPAGIRNAGTDSCIITVRVSRTNVLDPSIPPYQLRRFGQLVDIAETASARSGLSDFEVSVPAGQGANVPLEIFLPTEWGIRAGSYFEELQLTLLKENDVIDQAVVSIFVEIPGAVALNVVGATGQERIAQIDLGSIDSQTRGVAPPFGLRIRSTSGYRITITSDNQGELVHVSGEARLPYLLTIDGDPLNLEGPATLAYPFPAIATGRYHPMTAEAGPTFTLAGDYADRINITVSAN